MLVLRTERSRSAVYGRFGESSILTAKMQKLAIRRNQPTRQGPEADTKRSTSAEMSCRPNVSTPNRRLSALFSRLLRCVPPPHWLTKSVSLHAVYIAPSASIALDCMSSLLTMGTDRIIIIIVVIIINTSLSALSSNSSWLFASETNVDAAFKHCSRKAKQIAICY